MLSAARVLGMSCLNECETWGISMRGGAFPTWFSSRSDSVLFFNDSEPIFKRTAKFKEQFSVPWYIQAEGLRKFGQGAMNLLLDAAYIRASGRTRNFYINKTFARSRYSSLSMGQVRGGVRYMWDVFNNRAAPYVGFNAGLQTRSRVRLNMQLGNETIISNGTFFKRKTTVTGAVHSGVAFFNHCPLSFHVHLEFVFSGALPSNIITQKHSNPKLAVGSTGVMVSIPVAFGLTFNF